MARYKVVYGPNGSETILLTAEEETARDAEEAAWVDGEPARKWGAIRAERNALLAASDWMANSDVTMSDAWKSYRTALRDLPANTSDPANPTWPDTPGA